MENSQTENYTLLKEKGEHQLWKTPDGYLYYNKSYTTDPNDGKKPRFVDNFGKQKAFKDFEPALRYYYWTINEFVK